MGDKIQLNGKQDLINILDQQSDLVLIGTKEPLSIGNVLFNSETEYRQLLDMAIHAQPMGPSHSKRLFFTRQLDARYDSGERTIGTHWERFKKQVDSEDTAYNILVESGSHPELILKYIK
jgi:hypothetical protein